MGSVVPFQPRAAAMRRSRLPAGTAASIVIFPGVRYEHDIPESRCRSVPLNRAAAARRDRPGTSPLVPDRR